ncbi:uncharacterized protein [Typha angustifolia]|uniref:uncharacterized protein n=1 Tax=Typha angustifolia TaxID=59011 RepID=UPI003C2B9F4B
MDSAADQSPPVRKHPSSSKWKRLLLFWGPAVVTLLLAFCLTVSFPLSHLSLAYLSLFSRAQEEESRSISTRPPCVRWMAPFVSGGGYSSEAWSYVTALDAHIKDPNFKLQIEQHGDLESIEFWLGLPEESRALALKLYNTRCDLSKSIVICHSEPGAWFPPLFQTLPCPPGGYEEPVFVIGRTMFETDRLTPEHVKRCNKMDAIWVPTEFHVSTFVQSGVDPSKVVKVVQPIDVDFFDPAKHEALVLPVGDPVLVSKRSNYSSSSTRKEIVFLSIFKWEQRKGWDVLLRAFLEEFSNSDGVALHLLISAYHSDKDFSSKIHNFVDESGMKEPISGWAPIHVIDSHIPQSDLPRLYKAADAFVLPSRGEGWGRPIVEAMAMALPVIATNWSGPTEYLTEENGYPLGVDQMSQVMEGPFKGHLWAEPSSDRLRILMRHVVSNREEASRRGRRAREDMITRFSPKVVARLVADRIQEMMLKNASDRIER